MAHLYPTALILIALFFFAGPATAAERKAPSSPPGRYWRHIEIEVMDLSGRPLPGVKVLVHPESGRLVEKGPLVTGDEGLVRFRFEPVIADPLARVMIRDRFLVYRTAFKYLLVKEDYVNLTGRVEDRQEFASLSDPLFQGMDRRPSEKPLTIYVYLPAFRDYLDQAGTGKKRLETQVERMKPLITALLEAGRTQGFKLTPGSLSLTPRGVFRLGFEFLPLFDPSKMGLIAAGADLLRRPVLACLRASSKFGPQSGLVKTFKVTAAARFQYESKPWARPVEEIFSFQAPAQSLPRLLSWREGEPFPLRGIKVKAAGQDLDLSLTKPRGKGK